MEDTYSFRLIGKMPLLMHRDDVMLADELQDWRRDPAHKTVSVAGDDRSPPWTWQTYLYHDGTYMALPAANLMVALRSAGAKVPAKGKSTFKSLSQSGIFVEDEFLEFTCNYRRIAIETLEECRDLPFRQHIEWVRNLGFDLLVKRAKVGSAKHVRVRPMFKTWSVSGIVTVIEPSLNEGILRTLFEIAGRLVGIGDWRPSSKESPGNYGMFTVELDRCRV